MARLVVVLLLLAGVARADDSLDRIRLLEQDEQYAAALKELEAAYAARQSPELLLELAEVHRKLGHAREALLFYEHYLTAASSPTPEKRAELWQVVNELRRIAGVAAVQWVTRRDRPMLAAGLTLLVGGYAAALVTGSVFLSFRSFAEPQLTTASGTLLIPVLGPFVAGLVERQPSWSVPWIVVDGAAQVAGLVLTIIGARRRVKVPVFSEKLTVAPFALAGGGGVIAWGRF